MKSIRIACFLLLSAGACLAEEKKPAAGAAASKGSGLPAGAVEVKPGLYRHAGKDGKTWMYQRTPFGYSRYEENQAPAGVDPSTAGVGMKVLGEDGDTVRFERRTAFGMRRWESPKSDLTPDEQAAWQRSRKAAPVSPASAVPAAKDRKKSSQE